MLGFLCVVVVVCGGFLCVVVVFVFYVVVLLVLFGVFQNYKPDTHEAIYILGRDESVSSNTLSPVK